MRTAYFDCIGGISGDMTLGALLDAGADLEKLLAGLRTMDLPPWELHVGRTLKSGIAAATVEVLVRGEAAGSAPLLRMPPADAPLEGSAHTHEHRHEHTHEHSHEHGHSHTHTHDHTHTPTHPHTHTGTRNFGEVAAVIRGSGLPDPVKVKAEAVYRKLA